MIHLKNFWRNSRSPTFSFLLFFIMCGGCAREPWTTPLDEKQTENIVRFLQAGGLQPQSCPQSIDGDVSLSYSNIFGTKNISGYFQIISPSFLKFVISNPLGQPVFLLTSDQKTFQLINTLKRKYISGSVYSYGLLTDIPSPLLKGNWQNWIKGTVTVQTDSITDIRGDKNNRGTWVTVEGKRDDGFARNHLLIDPGKSVLLERIIEKNGGVRLAKITYGDWISVGTCEQPTSIGITDLKYQTEITVNLSDVQLAERTENDARLLTVPANYLQQIIP